MGPFSGQSFLGDLFNLKEKKTLTAEERVKKLEYVGYKYNEEKKCLYYPQKYLRGFKSREDAGCFTLEGVGLMTNLYFEFLENGGSPIVHICTYGGSDNPS